jgi:oxygen-independent coproporphyrinogen-3 oxidase
MWSYHPELLAKPAPRYTSYPTAVEFHDGCGADEYIQALSDMPSGTPLSLYVHIPYCHSICWYCGCNTGAAGKAQRLTAYLDALESEFALIGRLLGGPGESAPYRIIDVPGSGLQFDASERAELSDNLVASFQAPIGSSYRSSKSVALRAFFWPYTSSME